MHYDAGNWFVVMDTRIEACFRSSEFLEFQVSSFEPPYQHRQL